MTRIIRVETCDRCPHNLDRCGQAHVCTAAFEPLKDGAQSRRFVRADDFPNIPEWCPLERGRL
jgi:hypothetical protein